MILQDLIFIFFILFFFNIQVGECAPHPTKETSFFMANIDLETHRKRDLDPEGATEILPAVKTPSTNITSLDLSDYEDYEITPNLSDSKEDQSLLIETESTTKATLAVPNNKKQINGSQEARDEIQRLIGDLHRDEQFSQRTTVTKQNMTIVTTTTPMSIREMEEMFFREIEGSGMDVELETTTTTTTTTRKPLLFTTVIQEVDQLPATEKPDPFELADYDVPNHRDIAKANLKNRKNKKLITKKKKSTLHGGSIDRPQSTKKSETALKKLRKSLKKSVKINKKYKLRKLNDKLMKGVKRMRLRKIYEKTVFPSKNRRILKTTTPSSYAPRKFVGSTSAVTSKPAKRLPIPDFFGVVDSRTARTRRDKRQVNYEHVPLVSKYLEAIDEPGIRIEKSYIIEDEKKQDEILVYEPEGTLTQVEPSHVINESGDEQYFSHYEHKKSKQNSGVAQVTADGRIVGQVPKRNDRLTLVTVKGLKKVVKKNGKRYEFPKEENGKVLHSLLNELMNRGVPEDSHIPLKPSTLAIEQWS